MQTSLDEVDWNDTAPLLLKAVKLESEDPGRNVLEAAAAGSAHAAQLMSHRFTLIATNVPYLKRAKHGRALLTYGDGDQAARNDLANLMISRYSARHAAHTIAVVSPQNWLVNARHRNFRRRLLERCAIRVLAVLGEHAFESSAAAGAFVQLSILHNVRRPQYEVALCMDCSDASSTFEKGETLRTQVMSRLQQSDFLADDGARIVFEPQASAPRLKSFARAWQGIATSDYPRFGHFFWELSSPGTGWLLQQSTVVATRDYGGREHVIFWEDGNGEMAEVCQPGAPFRGQEAWGKRGIAVSQMRSLPVTLYTGERFDNNTAVITPLSEGLLPALWAFCQSNVFHDAVRRIDKGVKVTNATFGEIPFDVDRWREVAEEAGSLPEPWSDDPTQWLFEGRPEVSTAPLQVAVARLVGYRWPEQAESDDLGVFADADGIVCLPSVAGEAPGSDRVQQVLAAAFGSAWSPAKVKELLEQAGSRKKTIADWLRDEFFKQHCALFGNRPFVWHVWDGQRDGFSALVNYHRLDRKALEKLTYTYLGQDWVERQRAEVRDEVAGADTRLSAALGLQRKLEAILDGEPPFDIYVRWKQTHEQPVGWEPDLNDGVRLNVRPLVKAEVLRAPFNVHWRKDRGKNPDGSERENDKHLTLTDKLNARKRAEQP